MGNDRGKKSGQESKKGKPRSAGKSKGKIADYFGSGRLARKKIRRMLRANGTGEARCYAERAGQTGFFRELEASGLVRRIEQAKVRRRRNREERKVNSR